MQKWIVKSLVASLVGLSLSASALAADPAKKNIVIGTTVGDFGDMVKQQIKPLLEKEGYSVRLVEFTDYVRPNLALAEGSLDVNVFQHKPYLDSFAAEHKLQLTPVFQVPTAPLGLYSGKLKSLKDVKPGATVAAPNDPSNFARVLVMLNDLGWIKLKAGINPLTASQHDIAANPKNIKLLPLEAAQLPRARSDADFAVINGNYATSSGIKLTEALYQEKSYAYVNWGVVRSADAAKPWAKDVIAAYNSAEFKSWAKQKYAGYKLPANWK
ncbi:MetQ/NlpA family ABC transporter substrate-binding protein [Paludibacterium sp. THUN1379]|uniref:MetQ/NlpA family ABC transporter substrate-binding protein n=1 Tax=Paludibacterium sp. THUN1379 TaxID=3112107 RepID=UPI00308AA835|nr:MetQ/NlpA family ABC transporter substrate-binding protein [Paludibacterium sp. THUN1379]